MSTFSKVDVDKWQDVLNYLTSVSDRNAFQDVSSKHNCTEMVKYCYNNDFVKKYLDKWMKRYLIQRTKPKNSKFSKNYRLLGNKAFEQKNYKHSVDLYTKSICFAPKESEEYSLAFANRSAALFFLSLFEDSLKDIEVALDCKSYPQKLEHKLLFRKGKILLTMNKYEDAHNVFLAAKSSLPPDAKSNIVNDIEEGMSNMNLDNSPSDELRAHESINYYDFLPPLKNGESIELRYTSAALSLTESNEKGRHIVANTDINKGDVLFVEKPFAFVVLPDILVKSCHKCAKEVSSPIPCDTCTATYYCSQECLKEAWRQFHQWECGGLELLYAVGIAHLGLRVTMVSKTSDEPDRYKDVVNLVSHVENMEFEDLYQYSLIATLLLLFLEYNNRKFLNDADPDKLFETGGQIMVHICQLVCNGHAIMGYARDPDEYCLDFETMCDSTIATGIFTSASMMNHSCDPNIFNSFCGDYLVVKATRAIKSGEEVFNCYGPCFSRMSTVKRKEVLKKQYFFDCNCKPCQKEGIYDFLAKFSAWSCCNCDGPLIPINLSVARCINCDATEECIDLFKTMVKFETLCEEANNEVKLKNFDVARNLFIKAIEDYSCDLYQFHTRVMECRESISKCYYMCRNRADAIKYLFDTLSTVEAKFGRDSIELMLELRKLITVIMIVLGKYNNEEILTLNSEKQEALREVKRNMENYYKRYFSIYSILSGDWCKNFYDWNLSVSLFVERINKVL